MEYTNSGSEQKEYASKGVAGTALGLGIGALGLEVLGAGLGGLLGSKTSTTEYQTKELAEKDLIIADLRSQQIVDTKLVDVYKELRAQDKAQDEKIANLNTRVTTIETASPLREQIVLGQVQNVANTVSGVNEKLHDSIHTLGFNMQNQINSINTTLNNITKTVIPASSCCPEYMPKYNSWTAPTSAG